jgi:hypothetical protein
MTGASTADHEPTDDDMSPETLIREDGARDAHEAGQGDQADWDLSIVDEDDIGGAMGWMKRKWPGAIRWTASVDRSWTGAFAAPAQQSAFNL